MSAYDIIWDVHNEANGGWLETSLPGRKLHVIPDMDKERWFWVVVWAGVKDKFDKKKGVMVKARPQLKATGISLTKAQAKEDCLARAMKPRPRAPGEPELVEEGLDL